MSSIFKILEKEFCPPLDSSLLAALLAEVEAENAQKPITTSSPEIEALRHTLQELATHADAAQLTELADLSLTSPTEDTFSSPDFGFGVITADTSFSSQSSSGSSDHCFSSPLGFLRAALPDAPLPALKKALKHAEKDGKELDMWDLVASILSTESIRELEERGLDALDEQDGVFREEDVQWEIATSRTKKNTSPVKRRQGRGTKIALVDIRQQNHVKPRSKSMSKPALPDLWTQASSIATNIATYLPPRPPSFFLSYLHSPQYETPYIALCAALKDVSEASHSLEEESKLLLTLLDIILPQYEPLDSEQRLRLVHETQLAIRATNGRGDDILDIVKLLRELDADSSSGKWELGIYHLPPQRPPPSPIIVTGRKIDNPLASPSASTNPQPSSPLIPLTSPTASKPKKVKPDPYQWQTVPVRSIPDDSPHPLAQSIPAYTTTNGRKVKGSGNGNGKGGKGDVGEIPHFQNRIQQHRLKQEEYLKQAAKMWQRGDKKSRGGEIAFYYAEKAREFQELAKQEALENARIMVHSKRSATGKYDEIDLHGTTVFEAITIIKEILQETPCSPSQPFKIITGKGSHSVNKVGILKPAIRNALLEEGWVLGSWEGGLVVRGRNT